MEKELIRKAIGENIRALRLRDSVDLQSLAEGMGKPAGYLGLVERGRRGLSCQDLDFLSRFFKVSIDEIFKPYGYETP